MSQYTATVVWVRPADAPFKDNRYSRAHEWLLLELRPDRLRRLIEDLAHRYILPLLFWIGRRQHAR